MNRNNLSLVYSRNDASVKSRAAFGKWYRFFKDGPSEFGALAFENGFRSYAIVDLTTNAPSAFCPELAQTNMDPSLLDVIATSEALADCSMFQVLSVSCAPFGWATGENAFSGRSDEIAMTDVDRMFDVVLEEFGIFGGYCVPVQKPCGARSVVVYLGPKCDGDTHFPELVLKTGFVFEGTYRKNIESPSSKPSKLTNLERACIESLSEGMTNDEIGRKHGFSAFVIDGLLKSCCLKLGSKTIVQAVIAAVLTDEIVI